MVLERTQNLEDILLIYHGLFQMPGLKVIDTSFLSNQEALDMIGISVEYFDIAGSKKCANLLSKYYQGLISILNDDITFPEKVIEEVEYGRDRLRDCVDKTGEGTKKGRRRSVPYKFGRAASRGLEAAVKNQIENLNLVIRSREEFIREMCKNVSESRFTEEMKEHRERIYTALNSFWKSEKQVKIEEHRDNDKHIFTTAFCLSFGYPVLLFTADYDLVRMQRDFYILFGTLAEKFGIRTPKFDVEVLFRNIDMGEYFIHTKSGEEYLLEFGE